MGKIHCNICNRNFKNEEALAMHNASKHNTSSQSNSEKPKSKRIITKGRIISIIIVGMLLWGIIALINKPSQCDLPVTEVNIASHTNLKLHIHQDLVIKIDGINQAIPANIGVGANYLRPLHTHDASGEIHVEGPCVRDFILGEFFQVWGKTFDANQILDKTAQNGTITMSVNNRPSQNFENLVLKDRQRIVIEYNSI